MTLAFVALFCVALPLAIAETFARLRDPGLMPSGGYFAWQSMGAPSTSDPGAFAFDDTLGWVPRPGGTTSFRGAPAHIDPEGFRLHPNRPAVPDHATKPALLTLGDSFTFGCEVLDHETWPAQLEATLARPVYNGAVPGYGVDQMLLAAERLLARKNVAAAVIAPIADDYERNRTNRRDGVYKPFLTLDNGTLTIHPPPPQPVLRPLPEPLMWLGHSALFYRAYSAWRRHTGHQYEGSRTVDGFTYEIPLEGQNDPRDCAIHARLAALAARLQKPVPLATLLSFEKPSARIDRFDRMAACTPASPWFRIARIDRDLAAALTNPANPPIHRHPPLSHYSPFGNAITAKAIARELRADPTSRAALLLDDTTPD